MLCPWYPVTELESLEARIKELETIVAQGGKDAAKAKVELKRLQMEDPSGETKNEINAIHAKLAAKRALANPEEEERRAFEEEQKKVAEEKRKQEQEEEKKRQESKQRLIIKKIKNK